MTWAEFVKAVEDVGVKPDDEIWYIDICLVGVKLEDGVGVRIDEDMGISIT